MNAAYQPGLTFLAICVAFWGALCILEIMTHLPCMPSNKAKLWAASGSLAVGTAYWATQFLVLLAYETSIHVSYDRSLTAAAWLSAVLSFGLALHGLHHPLPSRRRRAASIAVLTIGWTSVPVLGGLSLNLSPAPLRDPIWMGLAAASALAAACMVLVVAAQRTVKHVANRRPAWRRWAIALPLTAAWLAINMAAFEALRWSPGTASLTMNGIQPSSLTSLMAMGSTCFLAIAMLLGWMEFRTKQATASLLHSLQALNSELHRVTAQDELTGLPNRRRLGEYLEQRYQAGANGQTRWAVLFVGLDEFKSVNDVLGHATGDEVLKTVAARLTDIAGQQHFLARAGGDEFVLVLSEADEDEAIMMADFVRATVHEPMLLHGHPLTLTASAGIALMPEDAQDMRILAYANTALQHAKRHGKNCSQRFAPEMHHSAASMLHLHADLRHSLREGGLSLFLQPKVDASSRRVTGAEALLRWHHPIKGLLAPGVFLEVAERFGLMQNIGVWTISEACRIAAEFQAKGHPLPISINLSARQFAEPSMVDLVDKALKAHGIPPALLWLEITEGTAMQDTERTQEVLARLQALGVGVAIDDFGTGYSSLSYLRTLLVQEIKLDRSFIADMETNSPSRAVIEAVVQLGHAMEMKVVVEGVESDTQRQALKEMGVDELQGYLFGEPMPPDELFTHYLEPLAAASPLGAHAE